MNAGLWLKLAKAGNPASTLTKVQAVDGALIHGWIDGQLNPYDDAWWLVRFTPRKPGSKWSEKNRTRVLELIADGRMAARGLAEVAAAQADGRWDAAYAPQSTATVPDDLAAALAALPGARAFFDALDATNRYAILYRIQDAKKPETRAARIAKFAAMCAAGERVYPRGRNAA
ncbi:YdeI/OmpD-associated family protein [Sphingomonas donggukensis]|uniref:YdeI/OmpD-associated family protein n=1 Tax=Sphingomonas donggukensis TaxID=2949093 RepID=A0ABY4TSN7_9SPHN|nr:YdeI/OmpD-associated family protein [Sphingomonas donggukensis]URW75422.1 YdeI/OmpD-associated family protein [Sphingomonas donggukensis]